MKKIYICAPLGGDVQKNIEKAKQYERYVLFCGAAPVVPHFYALILDDENPKERELGIRAAQACLWSADELWVFGNKVTEGMEAEIRYSKMLNIPVKYVSNEVFKIWKGDVF